MAEYEELKLSVVLDDQATAKLEQLKKNASGVEGHTKQVEGYNKALGQTVETGKNLQVVNEGIRERALGAAEGLVGIHEGFLKASISGRGLVGVLATVNRNVENMGANFGKVGLAVGGVAIGMVAAIAIGERFAKMLSNYAQTSVQRQRAAATIGIPSAQLKLYEQAYELHGFTKEQAHEDVTAAAEKAHELRRSGWNEFRAELTKGQPTPERMQAANEGVARLTEAARLGTPAYIRQSVAEAQGAGEQRRRELAGSRLSPEAIEEEVATAVTKMMVVLTGSTRFGQIGNVGTASKEDIERQKTADEQAQKHFLAMQKIWVAYGTATDKLSESLTGVALKVLGPISEKFGTWADSLKPEDFQKFADTLSSAVTALTNIDWKSFVDEMGSMVGTAETIVDKLNYGASFWARIIPKESRTKEQQAQIDMVDQARIDRMEHARQRQISHREQELGRKLRPEEYPITEAGERPGGTDSGNFRQRFTAGAALIAQANTLSFNRALLDQINPPTARNILPTDIQTDFATIPRPGGTPPETPERAGVFARAPFTPTVDMDRQTAIAEKLRHDREIQTDFATIPMRQQQAAPLAPMVDDYGRVVNALGENTDQLKSLNDKLGQRPDALGDQKQGATFDERFGGGATFDERFGGESPPPPRAYPQHSSWRDDTAPIPTETIDRAALYSAARNDVTHKVEGTGTLTVDVNAPQGTQVDAEAGGIFAKLEINRQMQMERSASSLRRPDIFGPI